MTRIEVCGDCSPPGLVLASSNDYEFTLACAYALKIGLYGVERLQECYADTYPTELIQAMALAIEDRDFRQHLKPIADDIPLGFRKSPKEKFADVFRNRDSNIFIEIWTEH